MTRLYDQIGLEPVPDDVVAEAIAAWCDDNPGADDLQVFGAANRLRRLNEKARQRQAERLEAERAGTTVEALRVARAELAAHDEQERLGRELTAARKVVGVPDLGRKRPLPAVSQDRVDRYASATLKLREADGTWPTQDAVAEALSISPRSVRDVGWPRILRRAAELAAIGPGSGGTAG